MKKGICVLLALLTLLSLNGIAFAYDYGYDGSDYGSGYSYYDYDGYNEYGFPIRDTYEIDPEYTAGVVDRRRERYQSSLAHFRNSANDGYAWGQYEYANSIENGWGCEKDYYISFRYYYYSAAQGHSKGQAALGRCYLWGRACEMDYDTAAYYFRLSANQGDDLGQLWLGYCYQNGYGVPKDRNEARYWYQQSACQGNASAKKRLKSL